MAADTRRLQPVKIGMTSVETSKDRFVRNEHDNLRRISAWRNNLTALSQRCNLYFVALESSISVYQPGFPFQTLGGKPCLTIPPSPAEPNAPGYLDRREPHTINQIVVGDLGTEEILLVATDSGNVAAYHTKAIRDATEKDPYKYSTDGRSDFVGLRPFFNHWVYESAWGLAIHKEARMIAVSVNTPHHAPAQDDYAKITVFAFALTSELDSDNNLGDNSSSGPVEHLEWKAWEPKPSEPRLIDRRHNYKTVLSDHIDNIPNISFVNSSHDRDGSWLLSTDIGGRMKLWHIWIRRCYRTWDFSQPENPTTGLRDVAERGWLVIALDPASFQSADSLEELCGSPRPLRYHNYTRTANSYDISNWVRTQVPNASQLHPAFGAFDDDQEDRDESDLDLMETHSSEGERADSEAGDVRLSLERENSLDDENEETLEESLAQLDETMQAAEEEAGDLLDGFLPHDLDQAFTVIPAARRARRSEMLQSAPQDEFDLFEENFSAEDEAPVDPEAEEGQSSVDWATVAQASGEDVSPEGIITERTTCLGPPRKKPRHSARYQEVYEACMTAKTIRTSTGLQTIAPFPVIQCSASHIRLINVPRAKAPHFFCASALKQTLNRHLANTPLVHMERLNMMQYIPELGIVIIATQIGRCAVCTLTKKSDTGAVGFRVDWILPTKEQERQGLRPHDPLLGIAAGPIQGRQFREDTSNSSEDYDSSFKAQHRSVSSSSSSEGSISADSDSNQPRQGSRPVKRGRPAALRLLSHPIPKGESWLGIENSRRYRLMLTYYDLTVLTYELWREAPEIGIEDRKNWRNRSAGMI